MADEKWINETVNVFSNAPSPDGSINTPSVFNVALTQAVDLHDMQVAVRNITFPTSWDPTPRKNRYMLAPRWAVVPKYDAYFTVFDDWIKVKLDEHVEWIKPTHRLLLFTLENQPYKTPDDITRQMLKQIYRAFPQIYFPKMRFSINNF